MLNRKRTSTNSAIDALLRAIENGDSDLESIMGEIGEGEDLDRYLEEFYQLLRNEGEKSDA